MASLEGNMVGAKQVLGSLLAVMTGVGLLMLPGARRLPHYRPTALERIRTVGDAAAACRQTGLAGWALVAHAQKLVARKFAVYSALNLWDSPDRAFLYGHGYCTQYNLALRHLLQRLGIAGTPVLALKVRVVDAPEWTMGHTWLRVTIDGETRDVCAGRVENEPGAVHFEPLTRVHVGHAPLLFLTHLGLIGFVGFLEWRALLTGSEPPAWSYARRLPAAGAPA